jgi:arsenate reductase
MTTDATMLADTRTRLQREFEAVPPETVDAVLSQATEDLAARARVETFIPVLAERRTRARLAELARRS